MATMKSTMMHGALTVGSLLEHGRRWNSRRRVFTADGEGGYRAGTYAEVGDRAAQLAHGLESLGVTGDQRVGTFMWNNQQHLEAYLAVPAMGAVLHTANIRLFPDQIAYTVNEARDGVMIVDASLAAQFAAVLPKITTVHTVVVNGECDPAVFAGSGVAVTDYEELLAGRPVEREWADVDEQDAASICFTTGTTGNPKGVAYSHRSILLQSMSSATQNALRIGADDCVLVVVPMFHATAWGYPYSAYWFGADTVLLDQYLTPAAIAAAIEKHRVTFANGVPTIWSDVLRLQREGHGGDLSSLRRIVIGGASVPSSLLKAYDELGAPILQGWGMTETSPLVSSARPPSDAGPDDSIGFRLSQGKILAGVGIRLVDPTTLEELPADGESIGEFELRGPWIAGGYLGDEGEDKFHGGWLRTGDVGTLDASGYVRLTDRAKDVIKSGGEWISSVDLEDVLLSHPDVAEVSVIGVPDERWDERPCAIVVPSEGANLVGEDLRGWLVGRVARWWIPERWAIVDELPRTSVGKFDKKKMRADYAGDALGVVYVTAKLPAE